MKKLPSVEALGCVDVICSDKTGNYKIKNENELIAHFLWVAL